MRLEQHNTEKVLKEDQFTHAMETADRLRERIRRWLAAHGIESGDSVEMLRQLREERDNELTGLR